jgi:hypothetical protein
MGAQVDRPGNPMDVSDVGQTLTYPKAAAMVI